MNIFGAVYMCETVRGVEEENWAKAPEGPSGRGKMKPGVGPAAWAGGTHEAGSETPSLWPSWFLASGV